MPRTHHTPGPWIRAEDGFIRNSDGEPIADAHCSLTLDPSEMDANDDLIAAAPDLLVALQELYEAFDGAEDDESYTESFRADLVAARFAIARATGEEVPS